MHINSCGLLTYSPSDLVLSIRSSFAVWMERFCIECPDFTVNIVIDDDPMMALLAAKGCNHERDYLAHLQQTYGTDNVAIVSGESHLQRFEQTLAYMKAGYPFIYQAQLQRDSFVGSADFLVKKHGSSLFGNYMYEALDTKLSKSVKHFFLIQLCAYSWMLEGVQGCFPESAAIILGDFTQEEFKLNKYINYFLQIKVAFLKNQESFVADLSLAPDPAFDCDYGRWSSYAQQILANTDSLALIAGIRKTQLKVLRNNGIHTLADLAMSQHTQIKGLAESTFSKLKAQSEIQHQSKGLKKPIFKIIADDNGKGLSALPPASESDCFFDIEGHPLLDGGLEYLWGVGYRDPSLNNGQHYQFKDWWAHTPDQEKLAFEGFVDWLYARWQHDKTTRCYHYAAYEVTAMRKLSLRYQTRTEEVRELLRHDVMVDLYRIVLNGVLLGTENYSIKSVEKLYRDKRTTEVGNGGDSVVFYEAWRDRGGVERWNAIGYPVWLQSPDTFDWTLFPELNEIRVYNIDDVFSTGDLVTWLRTQQTIAGIAYQPKVIALPVPDSEKSVRQVHHSAKKQVLREFKNQLVEQFLTQEQHALSPTAQLLNALLDFHDRERKPKIWSYFERLEKSDTELFDDDTCLHQLVITDMAIVDDNIKYVGQYDPSQPVRKDKFGTASVRGTDIGAKNIRFFRTGFACCVEFMVNTDDSAGLQDDHVTLFADEPFLNTETLELRLCQAFQSFMDNNSTSMLNTLLNRGQPVFKNNEAVLPINRAIHQDDDSYLEAIIHAVQSLDNSVMSIQGGPGAGKTFTAKHIIKALVEDGKRVGIMASSHSAITNLMDSLHGGWLGGAKLAKVGGFGTTQSHFAKTYDPAIYPNYMYRPTMSFTKKEPFHSFAVVGATAFAFASEDALNAPFDVLIVEEASQTALANLVAVSGAAKNLLLLGDQMQLDMPLQGSHSNGSGTSALKWLLGDHNVIPETHGIFLERTYRMHPTVTLPLSDVVYEGKLKAAAANDLQVIHIPNSRLISQSCGIQLVNAPHEGNRQSSEEEVEIIRQLIAELKTGSYTDKTGTSKPMSDQDIMILSPYNMQVNLLKERLGTTFPIGTVDLFQGQEAMCLIISMATSDIEECPRGLDFIFDINRLNVAISRAKALAIIVANAGLEQCKINNIEQMGKVSFFNRLISKPK